MEQLENHPLVEGISPALGGYELFNIDYNHGSGIAKIRINYWIYTSIEDAEIAQINRF